jgi:hypothetical protein
MIKFYKIIVTPCPLMRELLSSGDLVGYRVNSDGSLDLLVKAPRSKLSNYKPFYTHHLVSSGGFLEIKGRQCILRDVITSGLYIVDVKSYNGKIVVVVAGKNSLLKQLKVSEVRSLPPCIDSIEPLRLDEVVVDRRSLGIVKLLLDMGYFEYPKRSTLQNLSRKLGISKSTLDYRIRATLRKLLTHVIKLRS